MTNEKDIDINSGNNINTPVKFYYLFEEIDEKEKYIDIKNELCEFINSPPEFENPLFFNIDIYMGKAMDNKLPLIFGNYLFSRYMKINEKVFIYNIPLSRGIIPVIIFLGFYINVNFIGGIVLCFLSEKSILIKIIILILISIIIDLLFFICCCSELKAISRLDIVYSNNFDKVFIGLVNRSKKSYINKFTFEIDTIEKFILEPYNNSDKKFYLKVIMKNNEIQNICRLDEIKTNIEGLLFILNQKLNSN